jgi:hypothetical protein
LLCILFCFSVLRFVPNVVGVVHPRCRVLVVYFVLLFIFTFLVPCCDSRYDVHIWTMFGSSLPPVVCRMSFVICVCFVHSGAQHVFTI